MAKHIIPFNTSDTCYINPNAMHFWLGVNRINTHPHWTNPYEADQNLSDLEMPYSSISTRQCTCAFDRQIIAIECSRKFTCGICHITSEHAFYLKGICADDFSHLYDVKYYVSGLYNGRPYFRYAIVKSLTSFTLHHL